MACCRSVGWGGTAADSTFIVAAGNSVEDGAVAYDMGTALSDRLVHLALKAEAADWLASYAVPRGLHHPTVVASSAPGPTCWRRRKRRCGGAS